MSVDATKLARQELTQADWDRLAGQVQVAWEVVSGMAVSYLATWTAIAPTFLAIAEARQVHQRQIHSAYDRRRRARRRRV